MKPIVRLFEGMNRGDSALVRTAFAKEVSLVTIGVRDGKPYTRRELSINQLLTAIGTPHPEPWSEPIWDVRMEVNGSLAHVWASYAFYVGKRFSHCGVDSFQLLRDAAGEWKIFHLADTRQTDNCQIPPHIAQGFQ